MSEPPNWMRWQHEHAEALRALQDAQRAYHRLASQRAFARENEALRREASESLQRVDQVRRRLDAVRARQPR
jgi:hypothetical protein